MTKRNFHLITCLFTALTLCFVSCEKDDNEQNLQTNSKRITQLTEIIDPGTEYEFTHQTVYEYDKKGRVIKAITNNDYIVTYSYTAEKITIDYNGKSSVSYKLNKKGICIEREEIQYLFDFGSINTELFYTNQNELIKEHTLSEYTIPKTYNYSWDNGNIIIFSRNYDYNITYTNYENKGQLSIAGIFSTIIFQPNLLKGIYGKENKNLPASTSTIGGNIIIYEYELDKDGDITKMTVITEGGYNRRVSRIFYIDYK